jgi:hypothetical protein
MRRILAFLVVTVDGYYEGPNGEFDWPVVDEEFNEFGLQQLEEVDTLLFGRVTYEGMAAYWPTPAAEQDDPRVAAKMNTCRSWWCRGPSTGPTGPTPGSSRTTSPPSSPASSSGPARTSPSSAAPTWW